MTTYEEQEPRSGLELWLASPLRRLALAFACVTTLAILAAGMWADEALAFGGQIDWTYAAARRAVRWAPWALLFEPLYWSVRIASRRRRGLALSMLIHLPISFGVAVGMASLDAFIGHWILGAPPWNPSGAQAPAWTRFRAEGGLAAYWILLGLGWGVSSYLRNRQQERRARSLDLRAANLERDLIEAQLSNLRNQLHPHFLFNALHSVGGLIREGRGSTALSMLTSLSALLRTMIERSAETEITLNEELELVDSYLEIERLRLGDRLDDTTRLEAGVGGTRIPALSLLPIVENAIKYGIAPREDGGRLALEVERDGSRVRIEVADDGPGFPSEVLREERASIGLSNTRARLATLYGDDGEVRLENGINGGGRVIVWVPSGKPGTNETNGRVQH